MNNIQKYDVQSILTDLMDRKEFEFCVLHYDNKNYGYVQGVKYGMIEVESLTNKDNGTIVMFIENIVIKPLLSAYLTENYLNYEINERTVKIKKPKSVVFSENIENIRKTLIQYLFMNDCLHFLNVSYSNSTIEFVKRNENGCTLYATLSNKNKIKIEDIDTDTLMKIVMVIDNSDFVNRSNR